MPQASFVSFLDMIRKLLLVRWKQQAQTSPTTLPSSLQVLELVCHGEWHRQYGKTAVAALYGNPGSHHLSKAGMPNIWPIGQIQSMETLHPAHQAPGSPRNLRMWRAETRACHRIWVLRALLDIMIVHGRTHGQHNPVHPATACSTVSTTSIAGPAPAASAAASPASAAVCPMNPVHVKPHGLDLAQAQGEFDTLIVKKAIAFGVLLNSQNHLSFRLGLRCVCGQCDN